MAKIHAHQDFGIEDDFLNDRYVKTAVSKQWPTRPMDWPGYMYSAYPIRNRLVGIGWSEIGWSRVKGLSNFIAL